MSAALMMCVGGGVNIEELDYPFLLYTYSSNVIVEASAFISLMESLVEVRDPAVVTS